MFGELELWSSQTSDLNHITPLKTVADFLQPFSGSLGGKLVQNQAGGYDSGSLIMSIVLEWDVGVMLATRCGRTLQTITYE